MNDTYLHVIEVSSDGEIWQPSLTASQSEAYGEGAESYGRETLAQWIDDECPDGVPTDADGNPLVRIVIYPADAEALQPECAVATVYAEA